MSQASFKNDEEKNNNKLSLSSINNKLYDIFNNKNYLINNFLLKKEKIDSDYIIDLKEMNIFNFFLICIIKTTKYKDILKYLKLNINKYKKNNDYIILNSKTKAFFTKIKYSLPKFLNICIFNSNHLSKILNINNKKLTERIFELIHFYFLNNLIDNENLLNIIRLKLISSLYKDDENEFSEEFLEIKNKTIINIFSLEVIIKFLLGFKSVEMSKKKVADFISIINDTMTIISDLFLNNYNNVFLLSNNLLFYRLIELSQISLDCIVCVIPILLKAYKFTFNIDYCLFDLSEQFLFKKNENIIKKNNNIIAKNKFLYELFNMQNLIIQEKKYSLIPNGFIFNDIVNNGVILYNNNSFNFPQENFSMVISFELFKEKVNNKIKLKTNDNKKYTLFSFSKNEDTIDFNFFIENNVLKMTLFGKISDLFFEIESNKIYVLWLFHTGNNKKSTSIFYLNEQKLVKQNLFYPKGYYDINYGFNNNKKQNNFEGIIGTFILFNKCFIKDEKNKNNKFYEENLLGLKCNYEDISYINYKTDFSLLNSETKKILNKLSSVDNISRYIAVIISSKSIMSNDFCCCSNKNRKIYKANYFIDKIEFQSMISFNAENIDINLNNYNFNCQNCLITYPIHFNNSFNDFINNNGIKFLELELYYFIGIMDAYSSFNNNIFGNIKKEGEIPTPTTKGDELNQQIIKLYEEKDSLCSKLEDIFKLFLYCLKTLNKTQEKNNKNDIDNFFYTLNNLISLASKNGFKINLMFLSSVTNNIDLLIEKNKFFDHCGFILEYDSYDPNDDKSFHYLFQTILINLEDYSSDFLSPNIFTKILNFDKVYLSEKLKDCKKIYSQLIRKCLSLALINNEECFKLYMKKLKDFREIKKQNINLVQNLNSNIAEEEISEDIENSYYLNSKKNSYRASENNIKQIIKNIEYKENEEKKQKNKLILMYKALRNLYLTLEKNNKTYNSFINFCLEGNEIIDFFNEEFIYLMEKYEIKAINIEQKLQNKDNSNNSFKISSNGSDSINSEDADNEKTNVEQKEIIIEDEINYQKDKEILKYSEYIKALCIRFIDEISYEDNVKNIREQLSKKEKSSNQNNMNNFRPGILKSTSSNNLIIPRKNSGKSLEAYDLNSNLNTSNIKLGVKPIEAIIIEKFTFYNEIILSPYTFNSFFLLLFRNITMENKLKYMKNISNIFDKLLLSKKSYNDIKYFIEIILQLIDRVGIEDFDTIFMNKIEFLEFAYDKFNNLLFDMLDYYNDRKEELKPLIKNLFCKKDFGINFYFNILDNLKRHKEMSEMFEGFNEKCISNDKNENFNNELIDALFRKVKKNLYNIIDKTIFELTDPFYFKLLFEIYIKEYTDNKNCDFVLDFIQYIIDKFNQFEINNSLYINEKTELCHKNILVLIYKITFFISKRSYLIENNIFIKFIVLYLSAFCNRTNLLFLKLLFPIEEVNEINKVYNKKLIIEMLFEIFIELYLEFKKLSHDKESSMFEALISDLLFNQTDDFQNSKGSISESLSDENDSNEEEIKENKNTLIKNRSICYTIDELSIRQNNMKLKTFTNNILTKYLKISSPSENTFSVTILFLIKISIYIKKLEEVDKNSTLLNLLFNISEQLCKDAKKLQQKYPTHSPLISRNLNTTSIYEEFQNYILKDYILNKKFNEDKLLAIINQNIKISRKYACLAYTKEGKARLFSIKSHIQLISSSPSSDQKKSLFNHTNSNCEKESSHKSSIKEDTCSIRTTNTFRGRPGKLVKSANSTSSLSSLVNDKKRRNDSFFSNKSEKNKHIDYKIIPKFLKFFVRSHFSLYFLKLLTYDEDFILVKKIYKYIYHNEIDDIDLYKLNYPSKLKNRLGNNYVKHFLKKDFNFTSSQYFKYSHKCVYDRNFIPKTKTFFPSKKILEEYDYAHKGIIINKSDKRILTRNCELITYEGTIFGDIYVFENCILFKSDLKNDKRKLKELDCACSSMDFDFLEVKKNIIIVLSEIKEVIPRKFLYSWMALEIFMKNGKSYLFNFFNEDTNNYILDLLKNKNIYAIKNAKEYFEKKEYTKKWKDGRKSTYDHLLLLNKFSSRSYNDANQYPVMPWIFMSDDRIRNFDIPMSIQDEKARKIFLQIPYDSDSKENRWHSNHYSSNAYICYYLMRINPFTDSMIKFQSNKFDVPDRQFFDISQTLILCEKNNNNREPIPELYTIPEVYLNLNSNDFGKQALNNNGRIHDVEFFPYADNAYEFVYKFKFMLNNSEEINTKINLWFDFIFGINQFNKDNISGEGLRNFNKYCYGQNINIKKIINDFKKNKKSDSFIYDEIKSILGMVISFGQCPFQLLTSENPKRIYTKGVHNDILTSADKTKLKKDEQELFNDTLENTTKDDNNISNDGKMVQKNYDDDSKKFSIIYFRKSLSKNNLYCILNSKEIEVYQKDTRYKEYKYKKKINVSKNYLLFKKTTYGYPILKPKYLFCELKEEHFIFCRYLDNSIKLVTPSMETQILLNSFITSVIRINEKEFITGDNKGILYHWKINLENILNIKLKLIKKVHSNNNSITSILYNDRLNIVISADNKTVIIRSFHDFEFLTFFDVFENEKACNNDEIIVDIKLSNYDLVYILINKGNNNYKLKGYSLNGICFGKYEGKITNFELTKEGKVLVGLANMGIVNVLDPINFNVLYSRFIISSVDENECLFYHFYFEKPNIIFFGFKDHEGSKIKLITLNKGEIKFFI